MGENNSKWNNWQRIYLQNIQAAHVPQYQKNKQLNWKKIKNKKWAGNLERHTSKEDVQMANKHMKWCSTWFIIRENEIRTTVRYHLTSVRKTIIKNSTNKCQRGCGEKGTFLNVNWYSHCGKQYGDFLNSHE